MKTTAEKLLIKPDTTVWTSHRTNLDRLGPLPDGVRQVTRPDQATTALVWADDAASLRGILGKQAERLMRAGTLWVAYPKGNRADINRDTLWPILAEYGMRPVTQVAVDDVWSALRFRVLAEGEPPFTGGR